jgi:hypothetical protein
MSSIPIPLGPKDDPVNFLCGYCGRSIDINGYCRTGCPGIPERLKLAGFDSTE